MVKILVVDDNDKNLVLVRDILVYNGYEVIEAKNGVEAFNKAKEEKPALVLMDIQMPIMDGYAACQAMRADPATKDIKIVGLTSYAMKGDKEKIIASGFDDYIAKPIDTRALPGQIKQWLGLKE